eukprot:comp20013_c0_seq1/m.24541 comp20013_c0_seq1/g.24541  ORF comp20013_c0_seq1/g.24541 comp20013_c0_seq1/m.24541 type:complete len:513 (-) comp20013_c0_seq1:91-1629(-)
MYHPGQVPPGHPMGPPPGHAYAAPPPGVEGHPMGPPPGHSYVGPPPPGSEGPPQMMHMRQPSVDMRGAAVPPPAAGPGPGPQPPPGAGYPVGVPPGAAPPGVMAGPPGAPPLGAYHRPQEWYGPPGTYQSPADTQQGPRGEPRPEDEYRQQADWQRSVEDPRRRAPSGQNWGQKDRGHERRAALYAMLRQQTLANREMKDREEMLLHRKAQLKQQFEALQSQLEDIRTNPQPADGDDPDAGPGRLMIQAQPVPNWLWSLVGLYLNGHSPPATPNEAQTAEGQPQHHQPNMQQAYNGSLPDQQWRWANGPNGQPAMNGDQEEQPADEEVADADETEQGDEESEPAAKRIRLDKQAETMETEEGQDEQEMEEVGEAQDTEQQQEQEADGDLEQMRVLEAEREADERMVNMMAADEEEEERQEEEQEEVEQAPAEETPMAEPEPAPEPEPAEQQGAEEQPPVVEEQQQEPPPPPELEQAPAPVQPPPAEEDSDDDSDGGHLLIIKNSDAEDSDSN